MQPFNLENALKGEPVLLKNGDKGYVKFLVPDICSENTQTEFVGYGISAHDEFYVCEWDGEGNDRVSDENSIVGMWIEVNPKKLYFLPRPLKQADDGQKIFYISHSGEVVKSEIYSNRSCSSRIKLKNGQFFKTFEDAEMWLNAMRASKI